MTADLSLKEIQKEWHGTLKSYVIGFLASFLLTAFSFTLVMMQLLEGKMLVYTLLILAMIQALIQLVCFLHVGQEAKPRWETLIFYFMGIILLIIAIGSLWIMYDLNERVMSTMNKEILHD